MNARGLLISLTSAPKTHHLRTTAGKASFPSKSRPAFFQFCPCRWAHLHRVDDGNGFTWRVRWRRLRAEVKSEQYDVVESAPPESVRLDEVIPTEDGGGGGGVDALALPWWEQFPKRWVIVLLCFSAFLLCNMDRVINRCFLPISVFSLIGNILNLYAKYFLRLCLFIGDTFRYFIVRSRIFRKRGNVSFIAHVYS